MQGLNVAAGRVTYARRMDQGLEHTPAAGGAASGCRRGVGARGGERPRAPADGERRVSPPPASPIAGAREGADRSCVPLSCSRVVAAALLLALAALAPAAHAADRAFQPRWAKTVHGTITAVGNTNLTCPPAAANCVAAKSGSPR